MKNLSSQVINMINLEEARSRSSLDVLKSQAFLKFPHGYSENDIAVFGVSCEVANADDV